MDHLRPVRLQADRDGVTVDAVPAPRLDVGRDGGRIVPPEIAIRMPELREQLQPVTEEGRTNANGFFGSACAMAETVPQV